MSHCRTAMPGTVEIYHDVDMQPNLLPECLEAVDYISTIAPLVINNEQRRIRLPRQIALLEVADVRLPRSISAEVNIILTDRPLSADGRTARGVAEIPRIFGMPGVAYVSSFNNREGVAATVTHEVGHLLKLDHCAAPTCTMQEKDIPRETYKTRKYTSEERTRQEDLGFLAMQYTELKRPTHSYCESCADTARQRGEMRSLARKGISVPEHML